MTPAPLQAKPTTTQKPTPTDRAGMHAASNWMESCLIGLGLQAGTKFGGLNFEGSYRGRELSVHCSRRSRTRYGTANTRESVYHGHRLVIEVRTPVATRLTVARPASALERIVASSNRWLGAQLLTDTGLNPIFRLWALEKDWAERFVRRPEFARLLGNLMPVSDLPPNIGLKWWPGRLTFSQRTPIAECNRDKLRSWIDTVIDLAELAESDPPQRQLALYRWEQFQLENPVGAAFLLFGGLIAVFTALGLLFVAVLLALAFAGTR